MRIEELEAHLQFVHPQVYSFAFSLIPEELQADQVILDSLARLFVERAELIREILSGEATDSNEVQQRLTLGLMECVYPLASKRMEQLGNKLNGRADVSESPAFFELPLEERAVLFLKSETTLSWDDVALVCGIERYRAVSLATAAREHLAELCGLEIPDLSRVEGQVSDAAKSESEAMDETQYLYAPENREMSLKAFEKGAKCPLSRNLFPYFDAIAEQSESWEKFEKHLSSCGVCQSALEKVKAFYEEVHEKVPTNKISRERQIQYERDLREFLREQEMPEVKTEKGGLKAWFERFKRSSFAKYYVAIGLFVFASWITVFKR